MSLSKCQGLTSITIQLRKTRSLLKDANPLLYIYKHDSYMDFYFQSARIIGPMLPECWASIKDAVPAFNRHCDNL